MRTIIVVILLMCLVFVGAGGCTGTSPAKESTTGDIRTESTERVAETTTSTVKEALAEGPGAVTETTSIEETKIGALGERRNPIPVDQEARVGDWEVRVVDARPNANQIILDENMFNNPPKEGNQYVLVSLEATYAGDGSSTFWIDMLYSFVGGKGGSFDVAVAVAPDAITSADEALSGGSIAGNLVFEAPSDQVPGGTLLLEEAFSHDQARVFFAVR